uniref:Uncharacterized protein n=1 Tax=Megaselia scalaris TaxID=36166 RepID=T1GU83_MEGSC
MFDNKRWKTSLNVAPAAFKSSAGMPSIPALFLLFLSLSIALSTSVLDDGAPLRWLDWLDGVCSSKILHNNL